MPRNILFIIASLGLYWGLKLLFGNRERTLSEKPNLKFTAISFLVAVGLIFGTTHFGTKIPGSYLERSDYSGVFYINLFPDPHGIKSYRVPALINASVESETDQDEQLHSWREYRLAIVFMPNTGKIPFYNADECLKLNEVVTLYDDHGKKWGVELTDHPAN